jgi:hypothetical protein
VKNNLFLTSRGTFRGFFVARNSLTGGGGSVLLGGGSNDPSIPVPGHDCPLFGGGCGRLFLQ